MVREAKSENTMKTYRNCVRRFIIACGISRPEDITTDSLNDFVSHLRGKKCCDGHIANHLWAIRAFMRFLSDEGELPAREFGVKIPEHTGADVIEYYEREELEKIFDVIDLEDIHGLRLRVFIEVMLNTGLRPSEALSLDRKQIENTSELEVIGKGLKKRIVYLNEHVRGWIDRYLQRRKDNFPALFVTHCTPQRLSLRRIESAFQEAARNAQLHKRARLHDLRHTYTTNLLIHGCPLDYAAVLLGHSDVETTRKYYAAVRQKHAKEAHFKYLDYSHY